MADLFSSSSSIDTDDIDVLKQRMNKPNYTPITEQFLIIHLQNEFLSFYGLVGYIHRRQLTIVLLLQQVVHIISVIILTFHSRLRCVTGLEVLQ
jgi:hypothetical protein